MWNRAIISCFQKFKKLWKYFTNSYRKQFKKHILKYCLNKYGFNEKNEREGNNANIEVLKNNIKDNSNENNINIIENKNNANEINDIDKFKDIKEEDEERGWARWRRI